MEPPLDILVVDDDALIGWALVKELSALGFPTCHVGTAQDARERIRGKLFDFIFLDVHLPDGNGLELLGEIGENAPGTRIVMMSSSDGGKTRQRALHAGALQFLEKPFDVSEVRAILRSASTSYGRTRRHNRYICRTVLRISMVDPPGEEADLDLDNLWGQLDNIGGGGVRLRTEYPLKEGQRVRTRPATGRGPCMKFRPCEIPAEVVWVSPARDGVVAGLRFVDPPTPGRISLSGTGGSRR